MKERASWPMKAFEVRAILDGTKTQTRRVVMEQVLDPCCGSKMMYFDDDDPRVHFGDIRRETITVTDNSRGNLSGTRTLSIDPDTLMDFRAMPFADGTFPLVVFDPPHLIHAGPKSWLAAKYGRLSDD